MAVQRPAETLVKNEVYVDNSATPVNAPVHITPSAAPTNAAAGDIYTDSTTKVPKHYGGGSWERFGSRRDVKTGAATLTAADSGALCLFNNAAGFTYTLPPAEVGLWFDFLVTVTVTSSVARVACAAGDFLLGTINQGTDGTYTQAQRAADGAADLAWEGNGSTTGGIKGDWLHVVAISGTQWAVYGYSNATGTEATPFKTT